MLTKLVIRNFKRFEDVDIELGNPVVFIGPNNSGKTAALQALALWDVGLRRWNEKRAGRAAPEKRPGVTINRRDLIAVPVPDTNLLWRNLHVRNVANVAGKPRTENVRVDIIVEGVSNGKTWRCGLEFDYANQESFYCRPLRLSDGKNPPRMPVPEGVEGLRMAFLQPMSGLAANEYRLFASTFLRPAAASSKRAAVGAPGHQSGLRPAARRARRASGNPPATADLPVAHGVCQGAEQPDYRGQSLGGDP